MGSQRGKDLTEKEKLGQRSGETGRKGGDFFFGGDERGSYGRKNKERCHLELAHCGSWPMYAYTLIMIFHYTCSDSHMCMIIQDIH